MLKKFRDLLIPSIIVFITISLLVYCNSNHKFLWTIISILAYEFLNYFISDYFTKIFILFGQDNWKMSQRQLQKKGNLQDDTEIRISFAYLFRIKIDNKYFLVPSTRTKKYQPVGGVYKFYEEESHYLSRKIPVETDNCIPIDKSMERDYRLSVKNKDLRAFIKRFNKTPYRENVENLSREFIEEIFTLGIIKQSEFGNLTYKYCGRHMTKIEKTVFKPFELLLADIVEIRLTKNQEDLFRILMNNKSPRYKFATSHEIDTLGVKVGTKELEDTIANHTYKILSCNTDKLIMRNKYKEPIKISL
jgi:hypothetical protein